jgi:hypothetical protein
VPRQRDRRDLPSTPRGVHARPDLLQRLRLATAATIHQHVRSLHQGGPQRFRARLRDRSQTLKLSTLAHRVAARRRTSRSPRGPSLPCGEVRSSCRALRREWPPVQTLYPDARRAQRARYCQRLRSV